MTHIYESTVPIFMRDGAQLSASIFRPTEGTAPTLLLRTRYSVHGPGHAGTLGDGFPGLTTLLDAGYAVVWVETRGTFSSEGDPTAKINEPNDGYDTVEWIVSQPWSDGKVGTYGRSYDGMTQWATATQGHPAIAAAVPQETAMDWYKGVWYHTGGALSLAGVTNWHAVQYLGAEMRETNDLGQIQELTSAILLSGLSLYDHTPISTHPQLPAGRWLDDILAHPTHDDFWAEQDFTASIAKMTHPVLSISGWFDVFMAEQLRDFEKYRVSAGSTEARENSRLIVGPWEHDSNFSGRFPDRNFGPKGTGAFANITGEYLEHFNRWLRPGKTQPEKHARVKLFVMGIDEWREEEDWPLPGTRYTELYLSSGTAQGDGEGGQTVRQLSVSAPTSSTAETFTYDPCDPVSTAGGAHLLFGHTGPVDQRVNDDRADVLSFTGPVLEHDVEVIGYVSATLFVTSDTLDTDFTAKLIDVFPDGRAFNLCEGILRMRYRRSLEEPELMTPGQEYEVTIDMAATANVFLAGHRIRVDISSSDFPRFDRNTNTGNNINEEGLEQAVVAHNVILTGPDHPSRISLPIIER